MAFYRNYTNETEPLDEKSMREQQSMHDIHRDVGNEEVEGSLSENDDDNGQLQDEVGVEEGAEEEPSGRRWGSGFWKDCQPTGGGPSGRSGSGEESKSGSEYKNEEESDEVSDGREEDQLESEDERRRKEMGKSRSVPADEMLSDEYYEQDGDDQSDSLHYRAAANRSSGYSSKPQSRPVAASRYASGKSKDQYNNEYADYEDDDSEDEDDPDDPDYGSTGRGRGIKVMEALKIGMF